MTTAGANKTARIDRALGAIVLLCHGATALVAVAIAVFIGNMIFGFGLDIPLLAFAPLIVAVAVISGVRAGAARLRQVVRDRMVGVPETGNPAVARPQQPAPGADGKWWHDPPTDRNA
ncbi:hypothetical protein [Emcibacter sp. SYSU 3D8]|uniref:hypothetical protein n=1 Tax=Emcibacter sp. SYSU 3D8 TaxID=3133969 RepID=UPI0031FEB9DF